jgi:hypothetical protein
MKGRFELIFYRLLKRDFPYLAYIKNISFGENMNIIINVWKELLSFKKCTRIVFTNVLILMVCQSVLFSQRSNSSESERLINVSLKMGTNYRNADLAASNINNIIGLLPWTKIKVEPGDTISKITAEKIGVGTTIATEAYSLLEEQILKKNNLSNPEDLKPGFISFPSIPRISYQEWNENKISNQIPIIYVYPSDEKDFVNNVFMKNPKIFDKNRMGSQDATVIFQVTLEELKKMEVENPNIFKNIFVQSLPLTINFDSQNLQNIEPGSVTEVLDDQTKDIIKNITSGSPIRNTYVFILDSGWPCNDEYLTSIKGLNKIIETVKVNLKYPNSRHSDFKVESNSIINDNPNNHSCLIEISLNEFKRLDPNNIVKMIYIPLIYSSQSKEVLREILKIYYVILLMGENAGQESPPSDIYRVADIVANKVLLGMVGDNNKKRSDKVVIDALMSIILWYSKNNSSDFFFINESWTANEKEYMDLYDVPENCLIVAAAGNVAKQDIYSDRVYFSYRSINHSDTLAVINSKKDEPEVQCNSSIVPCDQNAFSNIRAVAFDGRVNEDICGTSFAAPRVAWLLALFMAYDVRISRGMPSNRRNQIHTKLLDIKNASASDITKYWLDPQKLLQGK